MTELEFQFKTELAFSGPVTEHVFELHCLPMPHPAQRLESCAIRLEPATEYTVRRDGFGAWVVCGSVRAPHERFAYAARGIARVDAARPYGGGEEPVNPALRQPTRLTGMDAAAEALWGSLPCTGDPYADARALNRAVYQALAYTPGATTTATTAAEALALGQGVCQDYAHLMLALARRSGFAARYCMGLIPGEGATHAWVELALPGGWHGFDPTHGSETDETYLLFAVGRDAADCPAERGVFRGVATQSMRVEMQLRQRA